jgi:hypothetical protein
MALYTGTKCSSRYFERNEKLPLPMHQMHVLMLLADCHFLPEHCNTLENDRHFSYLCDCDVLQTSTMYRDGNDFAQKEYSFKLQGVKGEGKDEKPTTFAKTQIDLAAYCSCETSGTRELIVELRCSAKSSSSDKITKQYLARAS